MSPQQNYAFAEIFQLVSEDGCSLAEAAELVAERLTDVFDIANDNAVFLAEQVAGLVAQELYVTEAA